jgi:hypothetical protein
MSYFSNQIAAVRLAITLVATVGFDAVSRAAWHLALANNHVCWGWNKGIESDAANQRNASELQEARRELINVAEAYGLFEAYQAQIVLNQKWKLGAVAPHCQGLPDYNIHWQYLDENGIPHSHERVGNR